MFDVEKKDVVVTSRIPSSMMDIIMDLAERDDRSVAYIVRQLIAESLEARGYFKKKKPKKRRGS